METIQISYIDMFSNLLKIVNSTKRNCPVVGVKKDLELSKTLIKARIARKESEIRLANTRSF